MTESRKSTNGPRRRAIALPHSSRLCAAAGSLPPPLLDGRKSVPSTAHANMCASIFVTGYPRSGKLPAPSRHRSPALSQSVRGSRLTPAAASRWSKICPIDRPRQHVRKHLCDRIPEIRQTARAIALRHSRRLCEAMVMQPRHEGWRHEEVPRSAPHPSSRATTGEGRVRLACDYVGACVLAFACTPSQWAAHRSLCVRN
jgi:hypothetical protein